jgi:hypothetical protein
LKNYETTFAICRNWFKIKFDHWFGYSFMDSMMRLKKVEKNLFESSGPNLSLIKSTQVNSLKK